MCNMSGKGPAESLSVKDKNNMPPMAVQQVEDDDEPLCPWAIVKPGNTKEKIAFFAAHQCSSRTGSMKIKSTWDIDERATKRRKKSVDLKVKIQLERMKESNIRSYQPEPFGCDIEHCSLHYTSDSGNGFYPGRPASVIEMVAFLEQRANAFLATCTKNCINSSATLRFARQFKEVPPASDLFCDLEACEESTPRGNSKGSKSQSETVHVLDMVARLESECLKHQRECEMGGGLSRNNSFRRHVGRVLLASGTQDDESEAEKGLPKVPDTQVNPAIAVTRDHGSVRADHCSLQGTQSWECASPASLPTGIDFHMNNVALESSQQTTVKTRSSCDVEMTEELSRSSFLPLTCSQLRELPPDAMQNKGITIDCMSKKIVPFPSQNPDQRMRESVCITSISVSKAEKNQNSSISFCEDPLPGMLFFLQPNQPEKNCSKLSESTRDSTRSFPNEDSCEDDAELRGESVSVVEPFALADGAMESTMKNPLQALESSCLKKQVSHDFLETRFKIKQLLEPPQYMAFLPHHIMVKIFRFLPTKSLVALKCTCCYFKFIIEYYNIRPADSRWVRDPRYKEDPCKKCKKKYVKGDVSLCRWHPKPYCQTLPYGPGYWMCCHRSQKGVPGCKLGLHDNHWVPDLRG